MSSSRTTSVTPGKSSKDPNPHLEIFNIVILVKRQDERCTGAAWERDAGDRRTIPLVRRSVAPIFWHRAEHKLNALSIKIHLSRKGVEGVHICKFWVRLGVDGREFHEHGSALNEDCSVWRVSVEAVCLISLSTSATSASVVPNLHSQQAMFNEEHLRNQWQRWSNYKSAEALRTPTETPTERPVKRRNKRQSIKVESHKKLLEDHFLGGRKRKYWPKLTRNSLPSIIPERSLSKCLTVKTFCQFLIKSMFLNLLKLT